MSGKFGFRDGGFWHTLAVGGGVGEKVTADSWRGVGFCHEHALILYVYLANDDVEDSVLTVSRPPGLWMVGEGNVADIGHSITSTHIVLDGYNLSIDRSELGVTLQCDLRSRHRDTGSQTHIQPNRSSLDCDVLR